MNGVLIDEFPKFLVLVPSVTTHIIQLENLFDDTHPILILLKLNGVTYYFKVRTPTWEKYEDQNIFKIELTAEATPCDPSRPEYRCLEQSMFDYSG